MERLGGLNGTGFELGNPDLFDRGLLFDELGHRYYFPNESGVKFISVTQFIGLFFEKFDGWATALRVCEPTPIYADDAHKALMDKWDDDAVMGSLAHRELEHYIKYGTQPKMSKAVSGYEWLNYKDWSGKEFFAEVVVFSRALGIAGTIDFVVRDKVSGACELFDWKTSRKIDVSGYNGKKGILPPSCLLDDCNLVIYSLQLSLYRYLLELEYGVNVSQQTIVHLTDLGCGPISAEFMRDDLVNMIEFWQREMRWK